MPFWLHHDEDIYAQEMERIFRGPARVTRSCAPAQKLPGDRIRLVGSTNAALKMARTVNASPMSMPRAPLRGNIITLAGLAGGRGGYLYLDIRTLQVAIIVICSVLGPLSLAFGPGQSRMRPSRFWGAGLVALAGGLALMSLRGYAPGYVSEVIGPALVGLALTFAQLSALSIVDKGGRDVVAWALLGAFVLTLLVLDRMAAKAWLHHLVVMGTTGLLCCRIAYGFERGRRLREGRSLRIIGIIFGLFGLSLVLDGVFTLAQADPNAARNPGVTDALMLVGLIAGLLLGTILLMWLMTERIQLKMRQLVSLDGLTGALVRSAFVQHFEWEVSRVGRRSDSRFAVLLINVDHFRRVNDALGHMAGDRLLVTIVEVMRGVIRPYDLIGRLEGDVFMLLMPGTPSKGAADMAERVRREIEQQTAVRAALKNHVTVSIGVALFGEHGDNWDAMLRAADAAARNAKANGRNRVEIAAPVAQPAGSTAGTSAEHAGGKPG